MTSVLVVDDVHASYGRFDVLRGVSLRVASGELVAVLGPNGAGKSTLLKTIAGFLAPRQGSITLDGEAIGGLRPPALLRKGITSSWERTSGRRRTKCAPTSSVCSRCFLGSPNDGASAPKA